MRINTILVGLIAIIIILGMSLYSIIDNKVSKKYTDIKNDEIHNQENNYISYDDSLETENFNIDNKTVEVPIKEDYKNNYDESTSNNINDEELINNEAANNQQTNEAPIINQEKVEEKVEDKENEIDNKQVVNAEAKSLEEFKEVTKDLINLKESSDTVNEKTKKVKEKININQYFFSLPYVSYKLNQGETLSDIARKYENKCNLNSSIKMIKTINNFNDTNSLEPNIIVKIPESTINNGVMYKVIPGDTWFKIAEKYYPNYDVDSVMDFIVYINNFPNNDLPLGELIFLPKL